MLPAAHPALIRSALPVRWTSPRRAVGRRRPRPRRGPGYQLRLPRLGDPPHPVGLLPRLPLCLRSLLVQHGQLLGGGLCSHGLEPGPRVGTIRSASSTACRRRRSASVRAWSRTRADSATVGSSSANTAASSASASATRSTGTPAGAAGLGYEFAIQGGKLPDDVVNYYVSILSNPDALRGSFGSYRAFDTTLAQNEQRKTRRLTMPVLAIGGAESYGENVGDAMKLVADDVQSVVIPGAGHWVAEDALDEMLAALTAFLASYRNGGEAA
jgi:pimeloyl-ACP methyl ester carboxylesterase